MAVHKGPVFMSDDEIAKGHCLAVKRLLNQLARLLEEDGCPRCAKSLRHASKSYRTVALEDLESM